jgi:hypothetical protein
VSASIRQTRWPRFASSKERFTAIEVFPDPTDPQQTTLFAWKVFEVSRE